MSLIVYTPSKTTGEALCKLLKRKGLNPEYYQNYDKVLEKIRFGVDDLFILDFTSFATISEMFKDLEIINNILPEELSIIIISPFSSTGKEMEPFKNKGFYILEKPIDMDKLINLIKKLSKLKN